MPRLAIDESGDLTAVRPNDEISLEVPESGPVGCIGGTVLDWACIDDLRSPLTFHGVLLVLSDRTPGAQLFAQLSRDDLPAGNEDRPIDRLVADRQRHRVVIVMQTKVAGDLLRGPLQLQ